MSTTTGIVYTFYSYKGGVGRSMAVANVAAMLAKWGHSVLVVDWDLEAPGLERFFVRPASAAGTVGESKPGIVDLVEGKASGASIDWRECVHTFTLEGGGSAVSLITAGRRNSDYVDRMQRLDFPVLFSQHGLGAYIEELRTSWVSNFDFVLVDSRTGVTDIGGICTVHLADVLVLLFTSTDSSVEGSLDIVRRAREARGHLPLDRGQLLAVPLPSRDESRTEYERAAQWKKIFAARFEHLYKDWLPSESMIPEAIELLKIPYVPYWSFGERLPAVEENSGDPAGLAYAYDILARLLVSKLDWNEALKGRVLAPPPRAKGRVLDYQWAARRREAAITGLHSASKRAFMEVYHWCVDSPIDRLQNELLLAARQAMVHISTWPIGIVLDETDKRPRPTNEGIVASINSTGKSGGQRYDYWSLTKLGDFYSLMSISDKDNDQDAAIYFDRIISRTTEALRHCASLYRALGAEPNATVELVIGYAGLRGRTIKSSHRNVGEHVNQYEDQVNTKVEFRLDQLDAEITSLVQKLCRPLFMLFDFFDPDQSVWDELVKDFVAGKLV